MTKMHLHVLDTESGAWQPATTTGVSAAFGGGSGRASSQDWTYAPATGGITDTSDDTLVAAGGAGTVNYLTSLQVINGHALTSTEVVVKSGSDVLFRTYARAAALAASTFNFTQPLRAAQNTALTVACITNSTATYVNAQGYTDRDAELVDQEYGTDVIELLDYVDANITLNDGTLLHVGGP